MVGASAAAAQWGRSPAAEPEDAAPTTWPQGVSHTPSMRIGEVVAQLKASFPALSISKVRYLETEGLITPHRVGTGYRQYSPAEAERALVCRTACSISAA